MAAQRDDPGSVLSLYRAALRLRREHLRDGPHAEAMAWHDAPPGVLDLARGALRCVVNLSDRPVPVPAGTTVLLRSDAPVPRDGRPAGDGMIGPDTAAWVRETPR